jgi:hypothetical protein
MKFRFSIIFLCFIFCLAIACNRKYRGMCKEDRQKMKLVAQLHKAQAKGSCPADKARIQKEKEEKKLAERSRQKAARK